MCRMLGSDEVWSVAIAIVSIQVIPSSRGLRRKACRRAAYVALGLIEGKRFSSPAFGSPPGADEWQFMQRWNMLFAALRSCDWVALAVARRVSLSELGT